jgi:uncharacterized hydrophobic protein (TIGR00271 family)
VFFLFPDRNQRLSRFFLLIGLASVIATSGIVGESVATVIGAMIVAPLMTPILGTMLAIVVGDKNNFAMSFFLVLSGAGVPVLVGIIYGLIVTDDSISAENNSEVSGRVSPTITDLIGALATGAVGSIALVRKDIAGTLPGVAIAISLVPPLCVVGLTLATGNGQDAAGALLLFATNFTSILLMGVIIMYIYKVHKMGSATMSTGQRYIHLKMSFVMLLFLLGIVAAPLWITSQQFRTESRMEACLEEKINEWANPSGWDTTIIVASANNNRFYTAEVIVTGEPPFPEKGDFDTADILPCDVDQVTIIFLPQRVIEL